MKIYCMSDIHGCLAEFEEALTLVLEYLDEEDTKLLLLGDYIHGGSDNIGVLEKIMKLQQQYGQDKVIALMGNHEEFILIGDSTVNHMIKTFDDEWMNDEGDEDKYVAWISNLPRYYTEGNTIFVHAGIDPRYSLEEQCETDLVYIRSAFYIEKQKTRGRCTSLFFIFRKLKLFTFYS